MNNRRKGRTSSGRQFDDNRAGKLPLFTLEERLQLPVLAQAISIGYPQMQPLLQNLQDGIPLEFNLNTLQLSLKALKGFL